MSENKMGNPLGADMSEFDMLELDEMLDGDVAAAQTTAPKDMTAFYDVPLTVSLEVATTEVTLGELSQAAVGDVLPLEKMAGEPLDVKVNGVFFAKAEVVIVDGKYGLKFLSRKKASTVDNA